MKINSNIKIAFLLGVIIFLVERYMSYGTLTKHIFDKEGAISFAWMQVYTIVISYSQHFFYLHLNKKFPWKAHPNKTLIVGIIGSLTITMVALFALRILVLMISYDKSFMYIFEDKGAAEYYKISFIFTLIGTVIAHLIYFFKALTEKRIDAHKYEAKSQSAKYESLKNQIDPHFLFNSLNVLSSLIDENPDQAQRFTSKMSKVYRYVLEQRDKTLVPLQEELKFAEAYLTLLKLRFENGLEYDIINNTTKDDVKIVPLSLQLLLENAVKHNKVDENNPLKITIRISNNRIEISNIINPKEIFKQSTKVGLENIIQRYKLISNEEVQITKTNNKFIVSLPLLTKIIPIMENTKIQNEEKLERARKKAKEIRAFYVSLTVYVMVISFLAFINYQSNWEHKWFLYPAGGWGLGILFQAHSAFYKGKYLGQSWEDKKVAELMNDERF
jgi:sensor histidine kinase YesM